MSNIIAIVWDFDKTLIDGYMEEPIFEDYHVNSSEFWAQTQALPAKYMTEQQVRVNPDTIYLNQMIRYAKEGKFSGLSNAKLRTYGERLKYYPGVPEIFPKTQAVIANNETYRLYDIKLEHYIVSTGLTEIIRGSKVKDYVEGIWGCEFIEDIAENGEAIISEIGYTIEIRRRRGHYSR